MVFAHERDLVSQKRLNGNCRDSANEGLSNPVNAGKTPDFAPHLAAGFVNPAERHGKSQSDNNFFSQNSTTSFV
jgi:hypothetical protein